MFIRLVRTEQLEKDGEPIQTIGWMYVMDDDGNTLGSFATLELPWKGNRNNVSCIPPGPHQSDKFTIQWLEHSGSFPYEHYWVRDVPGRSYIKIHRGNYYTQIEGCILVGKDHTDINDDGVVDVVNSTQALKELVGLIGKEDQELNITFMQ